MIILFYNLNDNNRLIPLSKINRDHRITSEEYLFFLSQPAQPGRNSKGVEKDKWSFEWDL